MSLSLYPVAVDLQKVGTYPMETFSGGGYVFDEVLEYRVFIANSSLPLLKAFGTYEEALAFHEATPGSTLPLVLVRQLEWIDEPSPGKLIHVRSNGSGRITEWDPCWLDRGRRAEGDIERIIQSSNTFGLSEDEVLSAHRSAILDGEVTADPMRFAAGILKRFHEQKEQAPVEPSVTHDLVISLARQAGFVIRAGRRAGKDSQEIFAGSSAGPEVITDEVMRVVKLALAQSSGESDT